MFTDARRETTYAAYRARLQAYLHIAPDASGQVIRKLIDSGFPASTARSFCDAAKLSPADRDKIILGENAYIRAGAWQTANPTTERLPVPLRTH